MDDLESRLTEYVSLLDSLGISVTKRGVEDVREQLVAYNDWDESLVELLDFLSDTHTQDVIKIWWDGDVIRPNYYDLLLEKLAKLTKGEFNPTEISSNLPADEFTGRAVVSFTLDGKPQKFGVTVSGDVVDTDFLNQLIQFINGQLKSTARIASYFFEAGNCLLLFFLTPERQLIFREHGIETSTSRFSQLPR